VGYLPQQMKVADTTTLVEETASAFKEVLALEAEIAALTPAKSPSAPTTNRPPTKRCCTG